MSFWKPDGPPIRACVTSRVCLCAPEAYPVLRLVPRAAHALQPWRSSAAAGPTDQGMLLVAGAAAAAVCGCWSAHHAVNVADLELLYAAGDVLPLGSHSALPPGVQPGCHLGLHHLHMESVSSRGALLMRITFQPWALCLGTRPMWKRGGGWGEGDGERERVSGGGKLCLWAGLMQALMTVLKIEPCLMAPSPQAAGRPPAMSCL